MKKSTALLLALLTGASICSLDAATIIRHDGGSTPIYLSGALGQSFITPVGPAYNNITFSWFDFAGSLSASGTLFLLDWEWIGLPEDISSSTIGYIAQSTSTTGGAYIFDPLVELAADKKYWVYMGGPAQSASAAVGGGVPFWEFYYPLGVPAYRQQAELAASFLLSGVEVIPEPSAVMLCVSAGLLGYIRFRRRPCQSI